MTIFMKVNTQALLSMRVGDTLTEKDLKRSYTVRSTITRVSTVTGNRYTTEKVNNELLITRTA